MNIYLTNVKEQLETQLEEIKKVTYTVTVNDPNATEDLIQELSKHITQARGLNINNCAIKSLPDLSHLDNLTKLELGAPSLEGIKEQNLPPALKEFNYKQGSLKSFPDFIWKIESIDRIRLQSVNIEEVIIPSECMIRNIYINSPNLKKIKFGKNQPTIYTLEIYTNSITELDESFSYLEKLSTLKIKAPIEKVNCDFSETWLREIHCEKWNLEDYSFLETVKNMGWLQIAYSQKKWKNLPDLKMWPTLSRLWIADCLDSTMTDSILEATNLIQLYVRESNLVFKPESFSKCKKLSIQLTNLPPVNFADCLRHLPKVNHFHISETTLLDFDNIPEDLSANWNYLTLSKNDISHDNLDFLNHLPKLIHLRIWYNPVSSPTVLLRKKTVPIDNFTHNLPDIKFKNVKQFCSFCSAVENSGIPYEDKEVLVNFMAKQKTLAVDKKWDWNMILKATNISQVSFRKKLMTLIDDKIAANKNEVPLTKESLVYITGKPKAKKTDLKKQAEELGIQLASKYSDKVTHVIIGMASPDFEMLKDKTYTPLTDNDLQRMFADTQPQFLKDNLAADENPEMVDNLAALLKSPEIINVKVGLEMIKNGGMPPQIFEPLLVVQKTTADAKIRRLASELLEIHAPAEWKSLIRDNLSFKIVDNPNRTEVDIRKQFRKVAKRTTPIITGKFSCMLFRQKGRGLRYALTAGKESKKEAYQLLLKDNHFDFSKGLAFNKRLENMNDYSFLNMPQSSVALPILALELDTIYSLNLTNCRYNSLDKKITQFKDLKHLNLSTNEMNSLPEYFAELKKIETINFSHNNFKSFPTILSQLPNLKKVDFSGNHEFEIPDEFRISLPDCEVVL